MWRCQSGVGEGTMDFPPGQSFPLEANLDFMNGGTILSTEFFFTTECCMHVFYIISLHLCFNTYFQLNLG